MFCICVSCHRSAEVGPLKKNAKLKCSACGSLVARSVRTIRHTMLNGGVTPPDEAKILTYAGLLSIARERGYPRGWIGHKYKAIYGVWPPDSAPEPANPSPELTWWIKKQNIEYAKIHFPRADQGEKTSEFHTTPDTKYTDETLMQDDDWDVDL